MYISTINISNINTTNKISCCTGSAFPAPAGLELAALRPRRGFPAVRGPPGRQGALRARGRRSVPAGP